MSIINNMPSGGGMNIDGIIEDYYVYAGSNISAGNFVEFINGVASSQTTGMQNAPTHAYDKVLSTYQSGIGPVVGNAILLRDGRIFIAYSGDGYTLSMSILTLENNIFSAGTITDYNVGSYLFLHNLSLLQINDSQLVLYCHRYEIGGGFASSFKDMSFLLTIGSDDVITVDTLETFDRDTDNGWVPMILLSDNTYARARTLNAAYATVVETCTVSGTSLTINKTTTIGSGASGSTDANIYAEKFDTNKALLVWSNGSTTAMTSKGTILSWSGTTVSAGTIRSGYEAGVPSIFSYLGNNKFCSIGVIYTDSSTRNYYFSVLTVSGTSISSGTTTNILQNSMNCPFLITVNSSKVFCSYSDGTSSPGVGKYGLVGISGTTVSAIGNFLEHPRGYLATCGFLWDENVVFYNYAQIGEQYTSEAIVNQTLLGVSGNIPQTTIGGNTTVYETQVRPTTTSQFDGIAKTGGTGGTSTAHKDMISIYTLERTIPDEPIPDEPTTYERCDVVIEIDSNATRSHSFGWISDASGTVRNIFGLQPGDITRLSAQSSITNDMLPYLGDDLTKNYNIMFDTDSASYITISPPITINTYTPVGGTWTFKARVPNTVQEIYVKITE